MVEIFDDRIEITNPGGLPKGLSKDSFGRVSIRRNELISDLFYRLDKVERVGVGFAMKVGHCHSRIYLIMFNYI